MNPRRLRSEIVACTVAVDSPYTLYTVPANCNSKVVLLYIVNAGGSSNTITVEWYRAKDTASYYLIGGKNVASTESIKLFDPAESFILMDAGDRLDVTIGSNGTVDAICTVEEEFNANRP